MRLLTLCVLLCTFLTQNNATIVIPFDNLGELSDVSGDVVFAKVTSFEGNLPQEGVEYKANSWNLEIVQSFKGVLQTSDVINIQAYGGTSEAYGNVVIGDINFEVGEIYLLFLTKNEYDRWNVRTLSYYIYKHIREENTNYFVPVKEALDIHIEGGTDDHRLMIIDGDKFTNYLATKIDAGFLEDWDDNVFRADKDIFDFYPELKAPPAHCTYLSSGGTPFRWNIFPSNPLRVYCDTEVDASKTNSHTLVGNAQTVMSTEYEGINLVNQGVVGTNYNPNCSGGSAAGGNFLTYSNTLNGGDNILMIFNDPCDQIIDLTPPCNGTLAVGGSYGYSPTHTFDGISWFTSGNGYVIVNNGAGCLSDASYTLMLEHEMTHALGLGHISGSGTANMNPSCCVNITALDEACLDYTYPPPLVPVDLTRFEGKKVAGGNLLSWTTASEQNSDNFELERSNDGDTYIKIATLEAQGFSAEEIDYQFLDKYRYAGNTYYRLKQNDFDGSYEYSDVLRMENIEKERNLSVFPNPATSQLNITNEIEELSSLTIVNMMGKVIGQYNGSTTSIDISDFANGIYYVRLESKIGTEVTSFVKI